MSEDGGRKLTDDELRRSRQARENDKREREVLLGVLEQGVRHRLRPEPDLLDDVRVFIRRFCVFPDEHCLTAVTLWAAHAHMVREFHTTPRLAVLSPEPTSGKTRALEVLDLLVPESLLTVNASPASIFRTLAKKQITLLYDECDAIWTKRGQDDNHEDLRALLNAGYKHGATIPRCVGPQHDVKDFPVYCAVALAGIGDLPDTIMSRAVIIRMRRRAPHEPVESFRLRTQEPEGHKLRSRLADWAVSVGSAAGSSWPELPPGIADRQAEVWEPLVAVADAVGGDWPRLAREACVELCKVAQDRRASLGIRLLSDLRIIFELASNPEAMHTETIVDRLTHGDDYGLEADAPWSDLRGKPIGSRGLAERLAKYDVKPTKVKIGGRSLQGYRREHLWDAWTRYLPPLSSTPVGPEPPEPPDPLPDSPVPEVPEVPQFREGRRDGKATVCPGCDGEGCRSCGGTGRYTPTRRPS